MDDGLTLLEPDICMGDTAWERAEYWQRQGWHTHVRRHPGPTGYLTLWAVWGRNGVNALKLPHLSTSGVELREMA